MLSFGSVSDEEDAGASVGTEGNGGGAPGDRDTCVGRVRDGTEGEGQVGGACAGDGDDDDDVVGGATAGVEQGEDPGPSPCSHSESP